MLCCHISTDYPQPKSDSHPPPVTGSQGVIYSTEDGRALGMGIEFDMSKARDKRNERRGEKDRLLLERSFGTLKSRGWGLVVVVRDMIWWCVVDLEVGMGVCGFGDWCRERTGYWRRAYCSCMGWLMF